MGIKLKDLCRLQLFSHYIKYTIFLSRLFINMLILCDDVSHMICFDSCYLRFDLLYCWQYAAARSMWCL